MKLTYCIECARLTESKDNICSICGTLNTIQTYVERIKILEQELATSWFLLDEIAYPEYYTSLSVN